MVTTEWISLLLMTMELGNVVVVVVVKSVVGGGLRHRAIGHKVQDQTPMRTSLQNAL